MISEPDFTSRVEKLNASGVDEREAPVSACIASFPDEHAKVS